MIDARPDVFNHNLETVPRLYLKIRPGARYFHSLRLLEKVKERDPSQFTKSGLMVGLGETKEEVMQVMDDMRSAVSYTHLRAHETDSYLVCRLLLEKVKERDPSQFTKSGLMVGLGETKEEVMQVMDDMRSAGIDFLTIGQYLQPTRKHAAVDRFVTPEEFKAYETIAKAKGFLLVSASPLTRSSYHADSDFAKLQAARQALHA